MHILSVKDPAFRKYGRVITNVDFTQLVEEMKKTPVPDGVVYEPGINALEALTCEKRTGDGHIRRDAYTDRLLQWP